MNKVLLIGLAVVVLGAAGYGVLTNTRAGQDFLLEQALQAQLGATSNPRDFKGLEVMVCAAVPRRYRIQTALRLVSWCVLAIRCFWWIRDLERIQFYKPMGLHRLLRGLLLTHFHRIISLALVI